jgi:hypothetical protein
MPDGRLKKCRDSYPEVKPKVPLFKSPCGKLFLSHSSMTIHAEECMMCVRQQQ